MAFYSSLGNKCFPFWNIIEYLLKVQYRYRKYDQIKSLYQTNGYFIRREISLTENNRALMTTDVVFMLHGFRNWKAFYRTCDS